MASKPPNIKSQFEFISRRVMTEAVPGAAACRYESCEDQDLEEEEAGSGEFFDLNDLPDVAPQCLFARK